jgi:K(+)-stimulated pyrophosphate-energized sodium pump
VLLAGLFYWRVRDRAAQRIGTAGHVASSPVGTMGSTDLFTRRLPGNFAVQVPRRGMEDRLLDYLSTPSVSALNRQFDFDRIAFNTGSATLTEPSREQLANIAAILRAYPNTQVSIDGYTDNAGDEATDTALSRARATAVMDTLRDMGVPSTQMRAEGYGSRNPVADNISEQGRARNRRVVLEVTSH